MFTLRNFFLSAVMMGVGCGLLGGTPEAKALTYVDLLHWHMPATPTVVFDVYVYQVSPYGVPSWTFCRRHADYNSTVQDVNFLQSYGYKAVFFCRNR